MVCVQCGHKTQVVNSRHQRRANQVWRRRRCTVCQALFTTLEAVQHELTWLVRDGRQIEPFSRDKLFLSLYKSCEHRPTALGDAKSLTETVVSKLSGTALTKADIVRTAQVVLNRFDAAASVHYRAFHAS